MAPIGARSIGHAQFAWDLRQNESVVSVFATMWGVPPEELLVSFDGSSLHLPPEHVGRGRGWYKDRTWLHTDQNLSRNGEECIQGFVALRDVHPGDATFTFLEGSHRWHKAFAETFGVVSKGDWYQLANQDEYNFFTVTQGCILRSLTCRKGDMVLWDSRTMHAGQQPLASRPEPNVRGVCYICMLPRSTLQYPVGDIAAKQKVPAAFGSFVSLSFWGKRRSRTSRQRRTGRTEPRPLARLRRPTAASCPRQSTSRFPTPCSLLSERSSPVFEKNANFFLYLLRRSDPWSDLARMGP
jgi:hypothetical protein